MSSLFAKARIVVVGNAHDLLGKLIDFNSPSALRQYIRDLETALSSLGSEKANQVGYLTTLTRERDSLQSEIASTTKIIQELLLGGHEDLAKTRANRLVDAKKELETKNQDVLNQQASVKNISVSYSSLSQKHQEMLAKLHYLEHLDRDTKAKEQSAKDVQGVGSIVSGGADISVDDITRKMQERNDVANASFDQAMGTIPQPEADPLKDDAVNDILNSLRPTPPQNKAAEGNVATV